MDFVFGFGFGTALSFLFILAIEATKYYHHQFLFFLPDGYCSDF